GPLSPLVRWSMAQPRFALAVMVVLAACSPDAGRTVTFGAAGPFRQGDGPAHKQSIPLPGRESHPRPAGAANRRLPIQFADDSGNGARATRVAEEFVDSPRIVAVVGHVNSGAMVSAAHVYDKHLAAVATTATSPTLTGISPWAFRVIPSDSENGQTIAEFANTRGHKRAAVLYENNPYGRGLAENFKKSFPGQIISIDPIVARGDADLPAILSS